jgi:hypothetical protein
MQSLNDKEYNKFAPGDIVIVSDGLPTDGFNAPLEVGYNSAGDVVRLRKTINSVVYEKTIENSDMVVATTQEISKWSVV